VVALVAGHVLLVRKHGVVPPFDVEQRVAALTDGARETERPGGGVGAPGKPS
jgi:hypothetical protein